jgi:hypothetical protein
VRDRLPAGAADAAAAQPGDTTLRTVNRKAGIGSSLAVLVLHNATSTGSATGLGSRAAPAPLLVGPY